MMMTIKHDLLNKSDICFDATHEICEDKVSLLILLKSQIYFENDLDQKR